MTTEFKLPELGENITSGDVVNVLVSVGDTIKKDQPVLELETDKATIEVPSSVSGVVKEIHIKAGDQAKVGQIILTLEGGNGQSKPAAEAPAEAAPEPEAPSAPPPSASEAPAPASGGRAEFKLPELGENITSGDVVNVLVSVGDTIKEDQPILELETDKATIEVPSSVSGVVKEIHMKAGDQANIGQLILTLETSGSQPAAAPAKAASAPAPQPTAKPAEPAPEAKAEAPAPPPEPKPASAPAPEGPRKLAPAAPSVRRLARELGVIINEVPGAGPGGRISQKDVKAYVKQLNTQRREAPPASAATVGMPAQPELPDFSKWGEIERERMSAIRRATARAMSQAWTYIPHVTNFDSVDITELEKLRKLYAKKAEAAGGKLTVTAIIIKVLASALQRFPKFNASIDVASNEIIFKKYYNIGIAVDTERGLVVPSIRDVEKKNIIELAVELNEIAVKARDRKLTLEEMQGSTFTITNLGGIGGTNFTPIVNLPEVAILGVSRGRMEPVYRDGNFEPRLMMPLALSYDHRLVDGADAARFLRWVAEALEQPFLLALEG